MPYHKLPGDEDEEMRFENEFLRAKLLAEQGALEIVFFPGQDVPLEFENELLKELASFEEDMEDIEEIPIYNFIGRPDFVNEKDLSDEKLIAELERLNDLLEKNNIIYSVLADVEDRQIYKFVTEELFQHPIYNIQDSEFGSHYFYEDFYPDHEYDTRKACEEFIDIYFSSDFPIRIRDFEMENIRNLFEICEFYETFEEFRNVEYEIVNAAVLPRECVRNATISFDAITSVGLKPIHYSGEATFELEYVDKCWQVIHAQFPGMLQEDE